ncbi:hypothetical protein ACNKHW_15860 [Shigella flexneri]
MTRNIGSRIEVATPLLNPRLKQRLSDIIDVLLAIRSKLVVSIKKLSNRYVPRGNRRKVRAPGRGVRCIRITEQPE